jgi:RHS repeat-associated protein
MSDCSKAGKKEFNGSWGSLASAPKAHHKYDWYIICIDPYLGRFSSPDSIIPEQSQGTQAWDRFAYSNNNPVRYTDPSGHCISDPMSFMVCAMVAGAVVGGVVNAVNQYNTTGNVDLGKVGTAATEGALIGGGAVIAVVAAAAVVPIAGAIYAAANADGNPTNEIDAAIAVGQTAIETVTSTTKIESQLVSKSPLLGIQPSGNMSDLANPVVSKGLSILNNISSSPTSRIWKGMWIAKDPIQVYEYVENGIGVVREQSTGALISVVERVGPSLDKLQNFVDKGKGEWLR